jgi:hypothetical protein
MTNATYFVITNFWGTSKAYTKRVAGLAQAVEAFTATRTQKGVRACMVCADEAGNGMVMEYGAGR